MVSEGIMRELKEGESQQSRMEEEGYVSLVKRSKVLYNTVISAIYFTINTTRSKQCHAIESRNNEG